MCHRLFKVFGPTALVAICWGYGSAHGQGGYNDDRVMIQGFLWESHQDGRQRTEWGFEYEVDWKERWYEHVEAKAEELADAEFDLIWLPPPSQGEGAGYHPQQLNDFDNNYGSLAEHKSLIRKLLVCGVEPVADVVINHRNGSGGWATFKNPDWPARFICSTDEFWHQPRDEDSLSDEDRAILDAGEKGAEDYKDSDWPNWHGARDLDHKNSDFRNEAKDYLRRLKEFGYRGWRYDMVKGFAPEYIAEYNFGSAPTFAVGEFLDSDPVRLTRWVDGTKMQGQTDPALKACAAFDFSLYEKLKHFINAQQFDHLPALSYPDGVEDGLIAINRDKSVTFLENHDTGFPQKQFDSFANDAKLMQGYAYILTHPGVPCVYWKHYFDWNRGEEIKKLVRARKYAGVHSGSYIKTEVHGNDYVAIVGDKPTDSSTLIVKIGRGFAFDVDPDVWGLETSGEGYAVWVRKSKKAETQAQVDAAKPPFDPPSDGD